MRGRRPVPFDHLRTSIAEIKIILSASKSYKLINLEMNFNFKFTQNVFIF